MQDGWVHQNDVRHGDEGRQPGEQLGAPGGPVVGEVEVEFQTAAHGAPWGLTKNEVGASA